MNSDNSNIEFSIIIPCLNEAQSIVIVVNKALASIERLNLSGEVIVSDNGSSDGSQQLAKEAGAILVSVEEKGYGAALLSGIQAASGTYIIMGDADDSYDLSEIEAFVDKLRAGNDLVMGTRLKGTILPGAMPWLHQYIGNPFLTWLGNRLIGANVSDYHCGLRGFNREKMNNLNLHTAGMEFASEMVAKSAINGLKIAEVPIVYHPDKRGRAPHLRTWQDGWRHLKFLLTMTAFRVFLVPGLLLVLVGIAFFIYFATQESGMSGSEAVVSALFIVPGLQIINIGIMTRVFSIKVGLLPATPFWESLILRAGFDSGLVLSAGLATIATAIILTSWNALQPIHTIISFISLTLAVQILSTSFTISILRIHERFD